MRAPASPTARRTRTSLLAAALAVCAVPLGLVGPAAAAPVRAQPATAAPSPGTGARDVIANLWEWNWDSVARECTGVLGPAGYGGVQVAPPQDSLTRTATAAPTPLHPWWEVYQPVDYRLTSRMGDEAQFRAMVSTCRGAGVKVYVDAVINHMTGQGEVSYGGVHYTKYDYPGLYGYDDFHHYPADCPEPDGTIHDFNNPLEVRLCELVGLSDLRTGSAAVRDTLAAYLNTLLGYGVSGFRVDAAKHIGQADLTAIESRLHDTVDGTRPYIALEVPPGGPGTLAPQAFARQGDLLGFDAAFQLQSAFQSYDGTPGTGNITSLRVFGERSGLLPSGRSLAFVTNHDTERNGSTLGYQDGATYLLATQFLLARGYGTPQVYASFTYSHSDDSPPANRRGYITDTRCGQATWFCTDRVPAVVGMVGWHNHVGNAPLANWYDDDVNLIAFGRGDLGWVALNNAATPATHTFATGLAAGTYCDVTRGASTGSCTGPTVTVDAAGRATVTVPAKSALAIDTAQRLG